jgi:hypothetical protein
MASNLNVLMLSSVLRVSFMYSELLNILVSTLFKRAPAHHACGAALPAQCRAQADVGAAS